MRNKTLAGRPSADSLARMIQRLFVSLALVILPVPAFAQGVVTSADPRASDAGLEILHKGGSATDAAMAMMLALTVVEPQSSGIGGGGFLVHHQASTSLIDTIDGRETAPAAATSTRFVGADGKPLSFIDAWPGGYSVGVPGNVALMAKAHAKWGKLPWADLFGPAIKLAEDGYEVTPRLFNSLTSVQKIHADFPEVQKLYWKDGAPVPVGTHIRNAALAAILKDIAAKGPEAFYSGANAEAISTAVSGAPKNAVPLTTADLASYQAKERAAVCGHYRVYTICGMGPPSSGATTVLQILGMVERFDMKALGKDNPVAWHLIAEAMQLAYADRETYLADRDFVDVPVAGLIDPAYLKARSRLLSEKKSLTVYEAGTPPGAKPRTAAISSEVHGTTHFIAIDRVGDIATMTSTVESAFGSQLVANGYMLNNELTDFTFAPEKNGARVANRVEAGKRPLSSMAPTIVYDEAGKPIFTVGAAGGKTIIMQVAKAIIARLDWGLSAMDSIGLGLVYFNRDGIILEQGTRLEPMKAAMEALGHTVTIAKLGLKANSAALENGHWVGAADPRGPGESRTE